MILESGLIRCNIIWGGIKTASDCKIDVYTVIKLISKCIYISHIVCASASVYHVIHALLYNSSSNNGLFCQLILIYSPQPIVYDGTITGSLFMEMTDVFTQAVRFHYCICDSSQEMQMWYLCNYIYTIIMIIKISYWYTFIAISQWPTSHSLIHYQKA